MQLTEEFAFNASLRKALASGAGPVGSRSYLDVISGKVVGKRLYGTINRAWRPV